jgi:hypothetical protein
VFEREPSGSWGEGIPQVFMVPLYKYVSDVSVLYRKYRCTQYVLHTEVAQRQSLECEIT